MIKEDMNNKMKLPVGVAHKLYTSVTIVNRKCYLESFAGICEERNTTSCMIKTMDHHSFSQLVNAFLYKGIFVFKI